MTILHATNNGSSPNSGMPRAQTLGVLIGGTSDPYESAVLRGIADGARPAQVICYTSGAFRSTHGFEAQRNVLFDLISPQTVDGLVLIGTLGHSVPKDEMEALCRRFAPIPIVSIALPLADIPCIVADSMVGITLIMQHLIADHGYRRIAFLRGPGGQFEAEERYRAYRDALAAHDLPFDPGLVVQGDYTAPSGEAAARELLARTEIAFDAIVSANDSMALGALSVLQSAGRRVPKDVALTGFDDSENGRYGVPALTSVRQSPYAQGCQAAQLLCALLQGETIPHQTLSPTIPIFRRSCGCGSALRPLRSSDAEPESATPVDLRAQHEQVCAAMRQAAGPLPTDLAEMWMINIFDACLEDLQRGSTTASAHTWSYIVQTSLDADVDYTVWHRVLAALLQQLHRIGLTYEQHQQSEVLRSQIGRIIGEVMIRTQSALRLQIERRVDALRRLNESMVIQLTLDELMDAIAYELPHLGVTACVLARYADPHMPSEQARLLLAYDQKQRLIPESGAWHFPARELIPNGIALTHPAGTITIVEALYSKEEHLGFIVLDLEPALVPLSTDLRALISNALLGVLLLQQQRDSEALLRQQAQALQYQAQALQELSTPVIPISDEIVILPLIGNIDANRAQQIMEALLNAIREHGASLAIIDITGVAVIDTQSANALVQAAQAVRLLGAQVMLTGIHPEIAQTLTSLGINLENMLTRATLQRGIAQAFARRS